MARLVREAAPFGVRNAHAASIKLLLSNPEIGISVYGSSTNDMNMSSDLPLSGHGVQVPQFRPDGRPSPLPCGNQEIPGWTQQGTRSTGRSLHSRAFRRTGHVISVTHLSYIDVPDAKAAEAEDKFYAASSVVISV